MTESDYKNHVKFGTSTWTYEGWMGTVYNRPYTKKNFKQTCLGEYAEYPYFSTVGIDHTFYGPASDERVILYAGHDLRSVFECEIALDVMLHDTQAYLIKNKKNYVSATEIINLRSDK